MKPIIFVDTACNMPYDPETLRTDTLGGSEASVIRIAEKLSEITSVLVLQHNRLDIHNSTKVTYAPFLDHYLAREWQAIIVVRSETQAIHLRSVFKNTPIWVWLHDLISPVLGHCFPFFTKNNIGFITNSHYLENQLRALYAQVPYLNPPKAVTIFNPIDDDLVTDDTPVDKNKLVYISSAVKGVQYVLETFPYIYRKNPKFELFLTNPNKQVDLRVPKHKNVHHLGPLPHAENIKLVRSALCELHLNHVYPETFGLALVEANAVGTPVLTHPLGAAPEVLIDQTQLINTFDKDLILATLLKWQKNRPHVTAKPEYRLSQVITHWIKLLS